jgi:SAM-dependent methyltransferase
VPEERDPQMELMFSFFECVHRKAPGSEASTHKALAMLKDLPPAPDIVEFGCGSGAATLVLAESTTGKVTAVDIHQPFLDRLDHRAAEAGLADRIHTVRGDMCDPPLADGSFDIVWSEGAIYIAGFAEGLRRWRRLLRPSGHVAVTDATWLSPEPPAEAVEFWADGYPAMTTIDNNLGTIRATGFDPIGHFVLPPDNWSGYFDPLLKPLAHLRAEGGADADVQTFADDLQREMDVWKRCGDSYGYVFYLARVT